MKYQSSAILSHYTKTCAKNQLYRVMFPLYCTLSLTFPEHISLKIKKIGFLYSLSTDIDIPTASTPTPAETPSTTTPTDDTTTPITTPTSSETSVTTKPTDSSDESSGIDYNALGQWVGIATAILLVLILLVILLVFIGCVMHSQRLKRVGFYRTHENTANVTLPHFSASLKTAHSQTLDLEQNRVTAITNGRTVHPTHASGEKEFYI